MLVASTLSLCPVSPKEFSLFLMNPSQNVRLLPRFTVTRMGRRVARLEDVAIANKEVSGGVELKAA